jgi:hypothetical protein
MGIKVELDYDAVDSIVVESLKEQYNTFKMGATDGVFPGGVFHMDKEKDTVAIKEHLKSIENVLRYNMVDEDFKEWKRVKQEETNKGEKE